MDGVPAQRGAVAGVAGEDGAHITIRVGDFQHGQGVVHGTLRIRVVRHARGIRPPTIHGKGDLANAELHAGRRHGGDGLARGFDHPLAQVMGVAIHAPLMIGRQIGAEHVPQRAVHHGRAVRVCGADGQTIIGHALRLQLRQYLGAERGRDAAVIDGQDDCGRFVIPGQRDRLGPDVHLHALVLSRAAAVATEAHGIGGGDVDLRRTCLPFSLRFHAGAQSSQHQERMAQIRREFQAHGKDAD